MSTTNAEGVLTTTPNVGFIKHVFSLTPDGKAQLINIVQYIVLAVIPVAVLDHFVHKLFPSGDFESKSSIELLAEVIGQLSISVLALEFVHRIATGVPTYTGVPIPDLNLFQVAISLLFTTIYAKGVIGSKVRILTGRAYDLWDGKKKEPTKKAKKDQSVVKAIQPLSGGRMPAHSMSRADGLMGQGRAPQPQQMHQQPPPPQEAYGATSSSLYSGSDANPLVNAQTPGMENTGAASIEPMAANAVLGGGGNFAAW